MHMCYSTIHPGVCSRSGHKNARVVHTWIAKLFLRMKEKEDPEKEKGEGPPGVRNNDLQKTNRLCMFCCGASLWPLSLAASRSALLFQLLSSLFKSRTSTSFFLWPSSLQQRVEFKLCFLCQIEFCVIIFSKEGELGASAATASLLVCDLIKFPFLSFGLDAE